MGLESATFIADLNITNPPGSDVRSQGDDHFRLVKSVLQNTFPHMGAAPNTISYTPSTIDPAVDNHRIFFVAEAASGSVQLPAIADVAAGFTLHYVCGENATFSITPAAGEVFYNIDSPLALGEFDGASFICGDDSWTVIVHWHGVRSINGMKGDVLLADSMTDTDVTTALGYTPVDAAEVTGGNQSLTANGYQTLPGGLIMQWGTVAVAGTSSYATFTFPTPFPTAVFAAVVAPEGPGEGGGNNDYFGFDTLTTTSLRVFNMYDAAQIAHIIVIGH